VCFFTSTSAILLTISPAFQGLEALIERFRNSVVMLEPFEHQPRIFAAVPHPDAGVMIPFPPSDNRMKLCRSVHSAQDVGKHCHTSHARSQHADSPTGLFTTGTRRAMRVGRYDLGNPRGDMERMSAELQRLSVDNYSMKKKLEKADR